MSSHPLNLHNLFVPPSFSTGVVSGVVEWFAEVALVLVVLCLRALGVRWELLWLPCGDVHHPGQG